MRRPTAKRKPRESREHAFPAPTAGLISNRNLAMAEQGTPGAAVLRNFFPTATGVVLRRGIEQRATLPSSVSAMFSYVNGGQEELFAATVTAVYRIGSEPEIVLSGQTSGAWSVVQFATAGGTFLIGVNGSDPAFQYDGSAWSVPAITFPSGAGKVLSDLSFVWVYKQRLYFVERGTLNVWYLPVDQIGGELVLLPLGGVFMLGGELQWGQAWSVDSNSDGGLSEMCVFVTTEGEVAAYGGLSPDDASTWEKAGTYRIGRPMGPRGFIRAGGDLLIATTVGLISLAKSAGADAAALGRLAVSYPIEDEWASAIRLFGDEGWSCETWPDGQMILIAPPYDQHAASPIFVVNSNTAAWAEFSGWSVTAVRAFAGRLYVGQPGGEVSQAWAGGTDNGETYVGEMMPLFSDMGSPASRKFPKLARVTMRTAFDAAEHITARFDYDTTLPVAPNPLPPTTAATWGSGTWGTSTWGEEEAKKTVARWRGVGGSGGMVSLALQITSADTVPLDAEVIRIDCLYQAGDAAT